MELSADEQSLLIVSILFIGAILLWAFVMNARGNAMLKILSERLDPELWKELGEPQNLQQAAFNSKGRWRRFLRSKEYRQHCDTETAAMIDDYQRRANRMMIVGGIAAALLLYRYWPLLKPDFL